jgi:hypothetical protein
VPSRFDNYLWKLHSVSDAIPNVLPPSNMATPGTCRLLRRPARTALFELIDQAIEIGIASAKAPRKPVPPALGYPLAISDNLELTCLSRLNHGFNIQALLD